MHKFLFETLLVDCCIDKDLSDGECGILSLYFLDIELEICHLTDKLAIIKV